jgi:hypothetical protein
MTGKKCELLQLRPSSLLLNSKKLSEETGRAFNRPIWGKQVKEVAALIRKGKFPESNDWIVIMFQHQGFARERVLSSTSRQRAARGSGV